MIHFWKISYFFSLFRRINIEKTKTVRPIRLPSVVRALSHTSQLRKKRRTELCVYVCVNECTVNKMNGRNACFKFWFGKANNLYAHLNTMSHCMRSFQFAGAMKKNLLNRFEKFLSQPNQNELNRTKPPANSCWSLILPFLVVNGVFSTPPPSFPPCLSHFVHPFHFVLRCTLSFDCLSFTRFSTC